MISVLMTYGFVQAGNTLTPPTGEPLAQFYTLSQIHTRLTTNATAVLGDHSFTFTDPLAVSGENLTTIYNDIPTIDQSKLLDDTTYLGITGNIPSKTLSNSSVNVPAGYYSAGTALNVVDTDLVTGNIKKGINIFGIDGDNNVVDTSTGNAVAGDILLNKIAWVAGSSVTGLMPNKVGSATIFTPSTTDQAITQGYYGGVAGDGKVLGDSYLVSSNIKSGITIFGVNGDSNVVDTSSGDATANDILFGKIAWVDGSVVSGLMPAGVSLSNMFNGSLSGSPSDYPQSTGGVDDYNAGGSMPSDSYTASWTDCSSSPYCGTDSNANKKDGNTNLVWSNSLGANDWYWANNCYEPGTPNNPGSCASSGDPGCKCVKIVAPDTLTGCDALGSGWRLPSQKELMQVYIDGSWGNLSSAGYYYWSATTLSSYTPVAWVTGLYTGYTIYDAKSNAGYYVRCVH